MAKKENAGPPQASLAERRQKATVTCGEEPSPAERDSCVRTTSAAGRHKLSMRTRDSGATQCSGHHSRPNMLVTLYPNDGDREQGVPFTTRLLQPEGPGPGTAFHCSGKEKELSRSTQGCEQVNHHHPYK